MHELGQSSAWHVSVVCSWCSSALEPGAHTQDTTIFKSTYNYRKLEIGTPVPAGELGFAANGSV